jgi:hypothetical protein
MPLSGGQLFLIRTARTARHRVVAGFAASNSR